MVVLDHCLEKLSSKGDRGKMVTRWEQEEKKKEDGKKREGERKRRKKVISSN